MFDLAEEIREEIRRREISQNQLQRETGISQANLSRFLNGTRDMYLETASRLIEFLGGKIVWHKKTAKSKR